MNVYSAPQSTSICQTLQDRQLCRIQQLMQNVKCHDMLFQMNQEHGYMLVLKKEKTMVRLYWGHDPSWCFLLLSVIQWWCKRYKFRLCYHDIDWTRNLLYNNVVLLTYTITPIMQLDSNVTGAGESQCVMPSKSTLAFGSSKAARFGWKWIAICNPVKGHGTCRDWGSLSSLFPSHLLKNWCAIKTMAKNSLLLRGHYWTEEAEPQTWHHEFLCPNQKSFSQL